MDEGDRVLTSKRIRVCYHCDHFDGYKCLTHLKRCWKFNLMAYNRTCTTDHYYYSDRITGEGPTTESRSKPGTSAPGPGELAHRGTRKCRPSPGWKQTGGRAVPGHRGFGFAMIVISMMDSSAVVPRNVAGSLIYSCHTIGVVPQITITIMI
ncbi:prostate and testis expressed protein 2 isoform X4 [Suricata suricatta]|uniref:prostate and testis expressed protein 2 isoform X4 n=1 Tax=Suricata suricatta TaxID=37032 RepID=UPI00115643F4|nr:prostate and testis expressed protein 2 isoform X4 [Suricata suricatta]